MPKAYENNHYTLLNLEARRVTRPINIKYIKNIMSNTIYSFLFLVKL